jgi:hypothetical protein
MPPLPREDFITVADAIARADAVLPGSGEDDPERWPAVIAVCEFIESDPEEFWDFVVRWAATWMQTFATLLPLADWNTCWNTTST